MPSDAARERALRRGPGFAGFLLAHHGPRQLDRCYRLWLGARPVWLCARCLGVYPMLFLGLALQLLLVVPMGWWDFPWLFLLPWPALVDWGTSRLHGRPGSNWLRTLTGAVLGCSLARCVYLNLLQPAQILVLLQLGMLTMVVVVTEFAFRCSKRPARGVEAGS